MLRNFNDIAPYLADEDKARELFERLRWQGHPTCPHCLNAEKIYKLTPREEGKGVRKGVYKCARCRKQFTVTVGTVFAGSHIQLRHWLYAIYQMCASKKGVSANQLHRHLGITYKSAWFMCHRVRYAMTQSPLSGRLGGGSGIVEVDETYIGGKPRNNPHRGYKPKAKAIVVALVERDGQARTFPVPSAKRGPLQSLIRHNVQDTAHIMTDQHARPCLPRAA